MSKRAKFRKKPVIIEAVEWDETQATLAILENLGMTAARHSGHRDKPDLCQYLGIATLEGVMSANKRRLDNSRREGRILPVQT